MDKFLRVKNYDKFQHYKTRTPPWIKLYNSILEDYEISCLQDASKLLLMFVWVLASRLDNKIPFDPFWLKQKLPIRGKIDFQELLDHGFLELCYQDASNKLAPCKQLAMPEREERESRAERENPLSKSDQAKIEPNGKLTAEALVELYNTAAPQECPAVTKLSPARRDKARKYIAMFPEQEFWSRVFSNVSRSKFLRGLVKSNGHGSFIADFDWLLTKGKDGTENCVKVHDGRYEDGN